MTVALYARYSSDNQNVASIDDQFRVCRGHAVREQWRVVGAYKRVMLNRYEWIMQLLAYLPRGLKNNPIKSEA